MRQRFRRTADGGFTLGLQENERDLLRLLPGQVTEMIENRDDPDVGRVFPRAYAEDAAAEAEYRTLMGPELLRAHQQALGAIVDSVDADALDEEQMHLWLGGIEVLRLVLGTRIGISDDDQEFGPPDPDDPQGMELIVYAYLSQLQDDIVQALSDVLPEPTDDSP